MLGVTAVGTSACSTLRGAAIGGAGGAGVAAVSGGDVAFTLSTAVFESASDQGAHAQYGVVTGTWKSVSADGLTNPLSFTRV